LMIAATAIAAGLPLFTTNPGDFAGLAGVLAVVPRAVPAGAPGTLTPGPGTGRSGSITGRQRRPRRRPRKLRSSAYCRGGFSSIRPQCLRQASRLTAWHRMQARPSP
jgi:hypothetical protein